MPTANLTYNPRTATTNEANKLARDTARIGDEVLNPEENPHTLQEWEAYAEAVRRLVEATGLLAESVNLRPASGENTRADWREQHSELIFTLKQADKKVARKRAQNQ